MANFYEDLQATARELINEFGADAQLTRATTTGKRWDPTSGAPEVHDVKAAVFSIRKKDVDGSRILATDKRALVGVKENSLSITTDYRLSIGSVGYSVVAFEPISPAGIDVLWVLVIRKS